ncbi:hypothetical protein [Pseudomonas sp.]|uniref:hypothetical protein n=1 Tax=Pseudomonas sp. TaxID=306 RepID=UPI002730DF5A|nr:hypothetical protein [Pseudomonas sp.]MDP2446585.1 hypothetical protein [Pseudomonas sp.]MDZ4334271.1 hypothetical protein [Pseudomonas sp.]
MIQDQFHPLDEIGVWGCTAHGLVRFDLTLGRRLFIDDAPWQYPGSISSTPRPLQIVRKPGIEPVPLAPELLEAERAQGRAWQNYALLLSDFYLFGQALGGWIYFASDGKRWLIRPGSTPNAQGGQPYSLTLNCRPFGYLDEVAVDPPVSLPITLADIGQEGTGFRFVNFETINSDGSRAILRIFPTGGGLPTGFMQVVVSDAGGVPTASLELLKSQADVRGEWNTTHPGIATPLDLLAYRAMYPRSALTGAEYPFGPNSPMFPVGGGTVTLAVTDVDDVDAARTSGISGAATYLRGDVQITSGRTGRVLALQFDDADVLCEFTYDTLYEYDLSLPAWTTSYAGSLSTSGASTESAWVGVNDHPWTELVGPEAQAARSISESITRTLSILRNGVELASIENVKSYSANHEAELSAPSGDSWCWSRVGGSNDITGVGRMAADGGVSLPYLINVAASDTAVTATANKGGPWPVSWATGPTESANGGTPAYAAEMPVGTTQRDADQIQLSLTPITYSAGIGPGYGVQFFELETVAGTPVARELALLFPHAQLLARGVLSAGSAAAYHPVTHDLVTDETGGIPETFI